MLKEILGEELIERARKDTVSRLYDSSNRVSFHRFWVVADKQVVKIYKEYREGIISISLSDPDLVNKVRSTIRELLSNA